MRSDASEQRADAGARETRTVWHPLTSEQENSAGKNNVDHDLQGAGSSQLESLCALSFYGLRLADLLPFLQSSRQTEFFEIDSVDDESVVKISALRGMFQGIGHMHGGKGTKCFAE